MPSRQRSDHAHARSPPPPLLAAAGATPMAVGERAISSVSAVPPAKPPRGVSGIEQPDLQASRRKLRA